MLQLLAPKSCCHLLQSDLVLLVDLLQIPRANLECKTLADLR